MDRVGRASLLALCALCACASQPPAPPAPGIDPVIAARAEGVEFRAIGHPDFVLHIYRGDRISLAWDYGANQETFPKPAPILPRWNGEIYETRNAGHTLRVEIRRYDCTDVNGQTHPTNVSIIIDEQRRSGCGFSL